MRLNIGMDKFVSFILSLGGLHDAEIIALTWTPVKAEILMSVEDINANFDDLKPTPGVFMFSGVTDVEFSVDRPDPKLKIYDWKVTPIAEGYRSEIKVSPSGKLVIQCAAIVFEPDERQ
jgi:hypothetical protein